MEISEGVKVDLLFTPRISTYQEAFAPLPETAKGADVVGVMERYADIMFYAALNAWELDGHGTAEDFPYKRGDFHGWMAADPRGFAEGVKFAVCAITGKTAAQLAAEEKKRRENENKSAKTEDAGPEKKKKPWISRIMGR